MTPQVASPPNRIPWPPLIYAVAVFASLLMEFLLPLTVSLPGWTISIGLAVMTLGLAMDVAAMLTMRRNRANILPHRAATALVTTGPFTLSRNPIYLGNTTMLAGAALAFGNMWFAVTVPFAIAAVTTLAITREERHMAASFGPAWVDYTSRVPRWLFVRQ